MKKKSRIGHSIHLFSVLLNHGEKNKIDVKKLLNAFENKLGICHGFVCTRSQILAQFRTGDWQTELKTSKPKPKFVGNHVSILAAKAGKSLVCSHPQVVKVQNRISTTVGLLFKRELVLALVQLLKKQYLFHKHENKKKEREKTKNKFRQKILQS
jgi:hypothetical protein